ncbi:2,5-diketo-D-gluconic acid reductase A [Piscirickettsia salmonis]|uniref:aldo/keto reductase n=1 Tax=Piscirickettsia salmonis TaxID=1238 RepID=UPI0012BAB264|nr:aldo/keto reductase [Piscirickettsia salmonis]QGP55508.1 2,5-diketo-D-gluconic acid reductase A [Piscirickettsia salmonis]QGP58651.1 2,5-diketo-D-gluconic acid reductase A [Piscirickettsia salmonis]QGP65081.1 2,5-diketo-D-gluconic acid reductase A [Piscirickettsia salmonis]
MLNFELSNGDRIPGVGLGTWLASDAEVFASVKQALECGYRHIDCAPIYLNEKAVGQSLKDSLGSMLLSRDELWVTSKLWNSFHEPEKVAGALKKSLFDLQLDYLDLYVMHWPVALKSTVGLNMPETADDFLSLEQVSLTATWQAMEELVRQGLVKNLGVSNFSISKLKMLQSQVSILPVVNQVESHPYLVQDDLVKFCQSHNIHVTAYAPLGSGGRPQHFKEQNEPAVTVLANTSIRDIAKKYSLTVAQVILQWQLQRGVSVIPKSSNVMRMQENLAVIDALQLERSDIEVINKLDQDYRYYVGSTWTCHGSPYLADTLWC